MAEEKKSSNKTVVIILIIVIVLLLAGGATFFLLNKSKPAEQGVLTSEGTIPYEVNVGIVKENEDLAEKLKEGTGDRIPLHLSTTAQSSDGENFKCVLGNPEGAQYDMYFDIYADEDCTDQIYISGLLAPGSQLEGFKSKKTFPKGTQDVVLVVTTVEEDHKTLHMQTRVSLTLIVN